jgi:cytochrome c assembly protein
VTLGYTTTFLVGALGICFVGQRCFSDFSPSRMHSLTRVTFILGCVAASLTAVGVLLGAIWAKAEWGRYWAWDAKETGGFAVILWQVFFLIAHRFAFGTARGILTMSLLGNIVVSLGWFGANLLSGGLHSYGTRNVALLLLAAVVSNLAFFLVGFAPAGWLRLRKA